jgi:peptide/nickel transport system substrate-binding protein
MDWTSGSTSVSTSTNTYFLLVYDQLVRVDPAGVVQPRLALSVIGTPDSINWTVTLRPNVEFSDGTPFDAQAVVFNWTRDANPATGGRCVGDASQMASFTAGNVTTIKVTPKSANSQFPRLLQNCLGTIGSPTAFQKEGEATFNTQPVGAGPYMLKEWVRNDHATFVKNPNYWDAPRPYVDTVIYRPVTDITQRANAFQAAGSSAVWSASGVVSQYGDLFKQEGYQVQYTNTWGGVALGFNLNRVPFNNVSVRQAFSYALNLQDINVKAAQGHDVPADTIFPPDSPFYDKSGTQNLNDLAKAQQLIDAYVSSHGPIKVNFAVATAIKPYGDAITQQLSRLKGVTINEQLLDGATTVVLQTTRNFDMIFAGASGVDPEPVMYNDFHTGGSNNYGYSNPVMDKLLEQGRSSSVLSVRKAAYTAVAKMLVNDVPLIPIYRSINPYAVSHNLHGVNIYDIGFFDFTSVWLS